MSSINSRIRRRALPRWLIACFWSADSWAVVLWALAAINLANGVWMLVGPEGWYFGIPAAVPDTGPLNLHFVRDIGSVYVTMAAALFWAGARSTDRVPLVAMVFTIV